MLYLDWLRWATAQFLANLGTTWSKFKVLLFGTVIRSPLGGLRSHELGLDELLELKERLGLLLFDRWYGLKLDCDHWLRFSLNYVFSGFGVFSLLGRLFAIGFSGGWFALNLWSGRLGALGFFFSRLLGWLNRLR